MSDDRGFTFVEILVVLVVLAIGMLFFLQTSLVSVRWHRRSQGMSAGIFLAQERLERIGALGWDRVTAGLERAGLPELMGSESAYHQEAVSRPGMRFLLVYERDAAAGVLPRHAVHCFWAAGGRIFDRQNSVRLAARRR